MMLCQVGNETDVIKKDGRWLGSRKYDGIRCLAICKKDVKLFGRSGNNITGKFPEIVKDLEGFQGILDGEIVCNDNFQNTQSRVHTENKFLQKMLVKQYPAIFNIFDILEFNGKNLEHDSLKDRVELLKNVPRKNSLVIVEQTYDLMTILKKAKENKWEGIIIKHPESKYRKDYRSPDWLKIKLKKSRDIKFIKFDENPAGIRVEDVTGIAIQCAGKNGEIVKREFEKKGYAIIEVEYLEEFESGKLRMPVFKELKNA